MFVPSTSSIRLVVRFLLAIGLMVLAFGASAAIAQTPEDKPAAQPSTKTPSPPTSPASRGTKSELDDVVQVLGPDGKPVFIPRGATWEEFQKFLKSRQAKQGASAPPFSVSSVTFEGSAEANEDTVTLEATLTISVNRDDEDVLVPLQLNDATLLKKPVHDGPHEAEFDVFDREGEGYRCWLRGKGNHELKLTLAVPTRRQGAARRLMLRLPETPTSAIKLIVPLPKVSARGLERGSLRLKPIDNGRSEIQAFGPPGNLLDLSWQSITDVSEAKSELQAVTLITATLRAESLVLEATQQIRSIQGTFDKLTVRLPPEFELLEVTGRDVKESAKLADSLGRVAVTLTAPTSGPVELKWVLSTKLAADAKRLPPIEGFEVDDARQQTGHVVMVASQGVNLRTRSDENRYVDEDTMEALRDLTGFRAPASSSTNTMVYRFLKQQFRLVFDVQKIEPYFTSEQTHLVRLAANQLQLETTLTARVFRGALLDLTLPWPGLKSEGWEAVTNDTPDVVEQITVEETATGPQLRIRLVDRKTRGDREFEIRLTTRRAITSDGSAFDVSLPFIAASSQKSSRVIVAPNRNLDVEWTPKNESIAFPTTPDEDLLEELETTRNVTAWRWDAGAPAFSAKVKVQQQSITTESQSELTFETRQVSVTQRIGYDVAFEPLAQVRLMVPRAISARVRFRLRDATGQTKPLPSPVFTALEIDQAQQYRLSLEPPQVGKFEVLAEFDVERTSAMDDDEPSLMQVPVVQSSDAEFGATRVRWNTDDQQLATLGDPAWKPELGSGKTSSWMASGAKPAIVLKVAAAGDATTQDFTVHRALIRTVLSEGRRHSQALFELDRDVREIKLTLPSGLAAKQLRAWWNQVEVPIETLTRPQSGGVSEVRLRRQSPRDKNASSSVQDGSDKIHDFLWLDFFSDDSTRFGWSNSHRLLAPQFASSVWVAQTIWQIEMPSDQHLLTTPVGYASQFHWQRSLVLWGRQPSAGYDRIDRVLNLNAPRKPGASFDESSLGAQDANLNVYPVSCFGPPQALVFWSMSRTAVVGCGTGLALLLGFLLIRIPATRHVLTFLAVGFAMALTALWFTEPVKVLLQPAILGAAMAVIAAWIDRVGHRAPQSPIVTLSSPSDFFAGSGSGIRLGSVPAAAEASTMPPQVIVTNEPISASGSASGVRP